MILSCDAFALLSDPVFDFLRTKAKKLSNLHRRQAGLFPGGVVPNPSGRNVQYAGDVVWGEECRRATMRVGYGHQTWTSRFAFSGRSGSSQHLFSCIFLAQMMLLNSSNEYCFIALRVFIGTDRIPADIGLASIWALLSETTTACSRSYVFLYAGSENLSNNQWRASADKDAEAFRFL
jgi:hypothetical protein